MRRRSSLLLMTLAASFGFAVSSSHAADRHAACTAPPPAVGQTFSGPVLDVLDGGRLCIAAGPTPDQWVQVQPAGLIRAAQMSPQMQRAVLTTAAFSKRLECVAGPMVDGAVQAVCTVQGADLADAVEDAGQQPSWQLWR